MNMLQYFEAQKQQLNELCKFEPFAVLFPLVDEWYRLSNDLCPRDKPATFGRFLLVCHKSFLSAASLVGQAQPDDASAITRRAIEVIRVAVAIKQDAENLEERLAYEQRLIRWKQRQEGEKPSQRLHIKLNVRHPLLDELMRTYGIMSDAEVHFTPEYFESLDWEVRGDMLFLNYFQRDQREIERAIIILSGTHRIILELHDWCVDESFSKNKQWLALRQQLVETGKKYAANFDVSAEAIK